MKLDNKNFIQTLDWIIIRLKYFYNVHISKLKRLINFMIKWWFKILNKKKLFIVKTWRVVKIIFLDIREFIYEN